MSELDVPQEPIRVSEIHRGSPIDTSTLILTDIVDEEKRKEQEDPLLENDKDSTYSRLHKMYQKLPRDHQLSMVDVATNAAFRAILHARRVELQSDLLNIDAETLTPKKFKEAYMVRRMERCVLDDIIQLLESVRTQFLETQPQHTMEP